MRRLELFLDAKAANTPPRGISKASRVIFSVLTLLFLSIGQVWGTTVEVISTLNYSTSTAVDEQVTVVENVLYFTGAKNDATTAPTFNVGTGTDLRLYKLATNGSTYSTFTFSVADGYKLDGIEFKKNSTTASTLSNIAAGTGTLSGNSWTPTLNSTTTSVTFTYSGTVTFKQQIYIINVTYSSTGSSTTPTVNVTPTSWGFGSVAANASASKTFSVSGSNLTSGQSLSISVPEGYSVSPNSISVTAATLSATDVTVSKDTETAGTYNGNMSITGAGLSSAKTVGLTMTVTAPAHGYQFTHDFTAISGFSSWGNSYSTSHNIDYDIYNGHAGNDDHVYFAGASKQTSNITNMPVAKNSNVDLVLDDPDKYISAVKFVCKQWTSKTKTVTLKYSTDGGANYAVLTPSVSESFTTATTSATINLECLSLPAKTNAVQLVSSGTADNQVGISSVSFDLVDKQTYTINKVVTGCTLSVTNGTSAITSAEAGDEVYVSITETAEGYENPELTVKDADDHTIAVNNGKFTMPAEAVTVTAAATKKQYTVTLAATNGKIQVGGVDKTEIVVAHGETAELTAVANDNYAFSSWATEDAGISLGSTTVSPMTITVTGAGTVTATFVSTAKLNPGFVWSAASAEAVKGQAASLPTLTTNPYSLTPTYVSTNTDVAEIDGDGAVTIKAVGSTTIKATYAEDATYSAYEASYTLTVKGHVTWHIIKDGVDAPESVDYAKDVVPTKPTGITSCDASISLVGWTTAEYAKSDDEPATLYTGNVPAVTDNAEYYAVWAVVEEGGWNEITAVANLTAGTYAIYAEGYFLKAQISDKSRFNNGNDGTNIVTDGKLTTAPDANCQWEISINAGGKFLIKNGTNYAGALDEKNKGALLTDATSNFAQWTITRPASDFVVQNVGRAASETNSDNAYLRQNGDNGWATYISTTGNAPRFFKYSAGSTTGYTTNCVGPVTVTAPTFDVEAGAYAEVKTVKISNHDNDLLYFYTTDGTDPAADGNLDPMGTSVAYNHSTGITINASCTLKAIAYDADGNYSDVTSAEYTINLPLSLAEFLEQKPNESKQVDLTGAIIWGQTTDLIFVQQGDAAIALYKKNHGLSTWTYGKKISGIVTASKYSVYQAKPEMNVSDFGEAFVADAEESDYPDPLVVNTDNSETLMVVDNAFRLVQMENVNFGTDAYNYVTVTFAGTSTSNYFEDELDVMSGKTMPLSETSCSVLGILYPWYESNTSYDYDQIAPFALSNISTNGAKAPLPALVGQAGGNDEANAQEVPSGETIELTASEGTNSTYKIGEGTALEVSTTGTNVAITGDNDDIIVVTVNSTRDFYANNSKVYYYKINNTIETYNISKEAASNGSFLVKNGDASAEITSAAENDIVTLVANPDENYHWVSWSVYETETPANEITVTDNQFTMPAAAVTVEATFSENDYATIQYVGGEGATGTPAVESEKVYLGEGAHATMPAKGTLAKSGNTFAGWQFNGEGDVLEVGATYNVTTTGTLTFKAAWTPLPANTDIITAEAIGLTSSGYSAWSDKSNFGTTSKYAGNSMNATGDNAGALQLRYNATDASKRGGIVLTTSNGLVLKKLSVTVKSGSGTLNVYAKNTAYSGYADVLSSEEATCGKLIGTVSATGEMTLVDGVSYDDNYQYIGMRPASGTLYLTDITITWGTPTPVGPDYTEVRSGLTPNAYYTMCLDKAVISVKAGSIWRVLSKAQNGTDIILEEVTTTVAGRPYIIYATETTFEVEYTGDAVGAPVNDDDNNGLVGSFSKASITKDANNYIIYNNALYYVNSDEVYVGDHRAYLNMGNVPEYSNNSQQGAPRRRVTMAVYGEQVATGMDELNASEAPVKVMIDGKFYILRGEKMYDATGRLVK